MFSTRTKRSFKEESCQTMLLCFDIIKPFAGMCENQDIQIQSEFQYQQTSINPFLQHQHQISQMPAKKAAKVAKVASKAANKSVSVPKSPSRSASKSVAKSTPKATKATKVAPKVDIKASKSPAKDLKTSKASLSKSKMNPSPVKPSVSPSKKAVSAPKKDVSPAKGKRGQPVKVDPPAADKKPETKTDTKIDTKDVKSDPKLKKTESKEQLVKVITKGGAAVDSLVPNSASYRVLVDGGKVYSATLNQSNLDANNNKFYIIQVLVQQTSGAIWVWNRWGRVGVPGQNALKGPFLKPNAINDFNKKLHQKTVQGNYKEIQIKYDDQEEVKKQEPVKSKGPKKQVKSAMDSNLQNLMSLIFDVTVMNNTMKEIGYDAKRMPLGKLGDTTIKQAYAVLNNLSQAIKKKQTSEYKKLSGEFYTLIPHDFGFQNMANFVLDNEEKVKEKLKMLETISDMKITTKLLQQKTNDEESIHDQNYKKLACEIKTLKPDSKDYKELVEYFNNTKGSFGKVQIGDIFEVVRPNEQKMYDEKVGNNMLLWHGSRLSNFVGILSQGLRIAPPEAPVSGYLFGKGIYLADMAEKSIHYCRSYGSDTALILLIEGAIGNPNVLLQSAYNAKELMEQNKKNSTKCHGSKAPPESSYVKLKNMVIPKGKPVPTGSGSYMGHNEFIVYNMNQARIRYVLRMDMKGQ